MLKLYESVPGTNVMSLRIGGPIGSVISPIINPNNLYIEGWHIQEDRSNHNLILLSKDIREILPQGFAVNDHDVLTEPKDLIRLKDLLDLNFNLLGLRVESESGNKYGKISDFAFDTSDFFVHKLYASQSIVKNFSGGSLSIDRSQILEVTDRRIIIEDPADTAKIGATSPSIAS